MALIANRKSLMTLFSGMADIYSHRVRIVLAEKGINVEYHFIEADNKPEDLIDLNPYNSVPTLVDRDLVLFDSQVIMEYLDERFPHPPLMPVDPVSRARSRQMLYRIKRDWYWFIDQMNTTDEVQLSNAKNGLRDALTTVAPIFEQKLYFMSDEFSIIDCAIAPILWRLPVFGIELPPQAEVIHTYSERLFSRESFRSSLSDTELEMR